MDETSNVNDDQYVDVNETINQDNVATGDVAGNVAADDAATTALEQLLDQVLALE